MATKWEGVFCALWTPLDPRGRLRQETLDANLKFLRDSRVRGLLPLGSTGEFLQLDVAARTEFLEKVVSRAGGLSVIANISDIRPGVVAKLGQFAKTVGAGAVAVLPPYFYPVAQSDLIEFFVRAGEAARLPLFLYNFPERTGNRIALETVSAVADRIPLAGVKQSGADFDYHRALVQLGREKNFVVFTGSDTRLPEAMAMGVIGCVSGLANAVGDLVVEIYEGIRSSNPEGAAVSQERMQALGQKIDQLEFPLNVAAAMEARGFSPGHPKSIVSPATQRRYQNLVEELKGLFRKWTLI